MVKRTPPSEVAHELRQEAGFGCAVCGCPIIDYHHIIEWREKAHFDVEHMVVLCPSHHREYGKLPREKAYLAKKNPINIRLGKIHGYLGGNQSGNGILLGPTKFSACQNAISYAGVPLFSYRVVHGQVELSVFYPDRDFWPEIEIRHNQVRAEIQGFWDIEFKTNWIKFRRRKGDISLSVDFRESNPVVRGRLAIWDDTIEMTSTALKINNFTIISPNMAGGGNSVIDFGPKGKIIRPSFAMKNPRCIFVAE